jgi:hypothetical protein
VCSIDGSSAPGRLAFLLVVVLALAPFLGKAFTIDDTLFLRVAEHALEQPLSPMAFTYTWAETPSA